MEGRRDARKDDRDLSLLWAAEIDQILREGSKRGRAGSHAAIERILKLDPLLRRAECWERMRKLKAASLDPWQQRLALTPEEIEILRKGYAASWCDKREAIAKILKRHPGCSRRAVWRIAAKLGLTRAQGNSPKMGKRREWSGSDETSLYELAGYEFAASIAQAIGRTKAAVQCKLLSQGESSRISDGYTLKDVRSLLHVHPKRVRRWITNGWLRVYDRRIIRRSSQNDKPGSGKVPVPLPPDGSGVNGKTDEERHDGELLRVLPISIRPEAVERLLCDGKLQRGHLRVNDEALKEFLKKHGSEVDYQLLKDDERQWLANNGFSTCEGNTVDPQLEAHRRHARRVRTCPGCGREIRGNAYDRHVKLCRGLTERAAVT